MCGAFSTAIISSSVPRSRPTASQSTSESAWPGGTWPETTVKSWATPRWVTGMPATAGTASGLERPGITRTGTPAVAAGLDLLEAAAEHEAVAALEPRHPLAGERPLDDQPVDLLLAGGPAARQLRHVDQLGGRRQVAQQLAGREPVGDHHVGLHQRAAAGHRDQLGVARARRRPASRPGPTVGVRWPRSSPRGARSRWRRGPRPYAAARGGRARPGSARRTARRPGSTPSPWWRRRRGRRRCGRPRRPW